MFSSYVCLYGTTLQRYGHLVETAAKDYSKIAIICSMGQSCSGFGRIKVFCLGHTAADILDAGVHLELIVVGIPGAEHTVL